MTEYYTSIKQLKDLRKLLLPFRRWIIHKRVFFTVSEMWMTEPYKTRSAKKKRIKIEGVRVKRVAEPPLDKPCLM